MSIFFVTKYAMAKGVFQVEADEPRTPGYLRGHHPTERWSFDAHGDGRQWHRTREAAEARAEQMRQAKIASLKKQIAKLEKMTFEVRA